MSSAKKKTTYMSVVLNRNFAYCVPYVDSVVTCMYPVCAALGSFQTWGLFFCYFEVVVHSGRD